VKTIVRLVATLLLVTASTLLSAQENKISPTKESCLAFVKEFYDWYVPKARDINVHSLELALKDRRSAFSLRLIRGVDAVDSEAIRNKEAGLDFDWILNSQDPGDPGDPGYLVSNSRLAANVCRVDVYRQLSNGKLEKDIIPELNFEHGRWLFVNFHYPDSQFPQSENLLGLIRSYLKPAEDGPKPK
jgi:hypothetical protein